MKRILLAEDDNDMRRFLAKALERAGYEVTDFDNGASAYERLQEEPFSLLLTDIVMPEMDGIELARRATEINYNFLLPMRRLLNAIFIFCLFCDRQFFA